VIAQEGDVGVVVDALGDGFHAQRARQIRQRGRHGGPGAVGAVGDEAAIHLERVERQADHARQRRVARAEVVQGELEAGLVEPVEHRLDLGEVAGQCALGDLELDGVRIDAGRVRPTGELVRQGGVA